MRLLSYLWSECGVNVLELFSNISVFIANHALHGNQTAVHNFGVLRTLPQNCSPPFGPMSLALCRSEISMNDSIRSKLPFLFLVCISTWWGFYYQSNSKLNDYGSANFEWLFLLDALIVLPIICFFCAKDKKEGVLKAVVLSCLAVLIGSYVIPEQSKLIWHYLENGRYFVV